MCNKPYVFIDSVKQQYPDPVCLLKVVVNMMGFLIKTNKEPHLLDDFDRLLESYLLHVKELMKTYQKLYKNHENQKKNLELLKSKLEECNTRMAEDFERNSIAVRESKEEDSS